MSNKQNDQYNEYHYENRTRYQQCARCLKLYVGKHDCEVKQTEQERVKLEGKY